MHGFRIFSGGRKRRCQPAVKRRIYASPHRSTPSLESGGKQLAKLRFRSGLARGCAVLGLALIIAACGNGKGGGADRQGGPGGPGMGGPVTVGYVVVNAGAVPFTTELPGRTVASQSSEVRPQVSGVIQKRLFAEGSIVRQGQPLYQIDDRLYRAATHQAEADLASAQASAEATRVKAERYRPLAEAEAVSRQDYTDAAAAARQAGASVAQRRAALETARINLRFTTVPAPITGRIGRSLYTVGALVTTSQADPLATIQRLDPIFVDIQQSAADLLALRRALATGQLAPAGADVRLKLDDGSDYGQVGHVEFSEAVVDPATGTVTLRAAFPNPQGMLLPGMFVRAAFAQGVESRAFLVPQVAVSRDPHGEATVQLVGPDNKAVTRVVKAVRVQGENWVVTEGLAPGDKVIVQGLGRLRPGATLKPVPADTPEPLQASRQASGNQARKTGG